MKTNKFYWLNYDQQLIGINNGNYIAVRKYDDALAYYFNNELSEELQALESLSIQLPQQRQLVNQVVDETSPDGDYMEVCDYDPENQLVSYIDNEYNEMDTFDFLGHILPDTDKVESLEELIAVRKLGIQSIDLDQLLTQFVKFTEYKQERRHLLADQIYKQLPLDQAISRAKREVFTKHEGTDLSLSLALRGLLIDYGLDSTLLLLNEPGKEAWYGCGYLDPDTEEYRVIDIKSIVKDACKEEIISLSLNELSIPGDAYSFTQTNVAIIDEESAGCVQYLSSQPLATILEILEETKSQPKHTLRYINESLSTVLYQKEYKKDLWKTYPKEQNFFSQLCFAKEQLASGKYDERSVALLLAERASQNDLDHWLIKYTAQGRPCWGNLVVEYGDCYICTKGEATHLYQTVESGHLNEFIHEIQSPETFCKNHPEAVVIEPYFLEKKNTGTIKLSAFTHALFYQTRMEQSNPEDYLLGIPKRIRKIKK